MITCQNIRVLFFLFFFLPLFRVFLLVFFIYTLWPINRYRNNSKPQNHHTNNRLTEIVELDLTQWSTSNPSLNATSALSNASNSAVGVSTGSVTSGGSAMGSVHLTHVQVHGNAPTASPEFSGLTPTHTGSSGMSNNQSTLGMGTATKREPYLQKWFSTSSSSPQSTANAQTHSNAGDSISVNASPAASSLAAMSVDSNESMQQNSSITTNTSKQKITTNGDHSSHKQNKSFNNSHSNNAADDNKTMKQNTTQQKQQKSSRRTTSLLNLFMSNSQGKTTSCVIYQIK